MLEFIVRAKDLGANKAVYICAGGYSAGALHLARAHGITLLKLNKETGNLEPADKADTSTITPARKSTARTGRRKKSRLK